jgi:acyl-CoA synthetase (AMP-forming)/AMP-acid ligase II
VTALFGLWALGAVPVPVGVPFQRKDRDVFLQHVAETAGRMDARFLCVSGEEPEAERGPLRIVNAAAFDGCPGDSDAGMPDPDAHTGAAFIQLTSGSTRRPRGVVIRHDRLMLHMRAMSTALPSHAESVAVSWLPLHHDMGLVGGLLFPFYNGFPAHMISTAEFQARPGVWLETMSRFRATIAAAPPSAYAMCAQLAPRLLEGGVDLSAWECAMVGAEPIPPAVLRRFSAAFAPAGFRADAFFPVYGLAEATVAVTFPQLLAPVRFDRVDGPALSGGHARPCERSPLEFTGVGAPIPGTELRIEDPLGHGLPDRRVGEIVVRAASMSDGYYGEPETTAEVFQQGWLRTGDLGYRAEGCVFITGRKKEMIIKGGQNFIPAVLEEVVTSVEGVRPGGAAAVGVRCDERHTELVCIAAETRLEPHLHPDLMHRIRAALKTCGVVADRIVLLPPKSIPKTTSGKVQRMAVRQMFESEMQAAPGAA